MKAVYKRELQAFFHTMTGYAFISFLMVMAGIYTMYIHFSQGYSQFEYVISSLCFFYLLAVPILTMKAIAEEKKQKTDQLLYSLPFHMSQVVLGKFFAMVTVLAIPVGELCLIPLLLTRLGTLSVKIAISAVFGYFLLGCALIAVGLFLSSLTENQIVAAVLCFFTLLICYLMNSLCSLLSASAITSYISYLLLILAFCAILYFMTKKLFFSGIFLVLLEAGLSIWYWLKPTSFEGSIQHILAQVSVFDRLGNFLNGIFDWTTIVYYISIMFLFIFLTVQSMEKRRWSSFSVGIYSTCLSLFALAMVIGLNLLINHLPSNKTKMDLTSDSLYSISEQSKQIIEELQEDITIYLLAKSGSEDKTIIEFLSQYTAVNSHIKVEFKDPVLYPNFSEQYTEEKLTSGGNDLIVVQGNRSRFISNSSIYVSDYSLNSDTYSYETTYSYDIENQVTSAIDYVTTDNLPKLYRLTGHGEAQLPEAAANSITLENIEIQDLNLVSQKEIPSDCSALLLYCPKSDLSAKELEVIQAYLTSGGNFMIVTEYVAKDMKNFQTLLKTYGMSLAKGLVVEKDTTLYYQNQTFLLPNIQSHAITDSIISGGYRILMPYCQGIQIADDTRSTLTVQKLLTTSGAAYAKSAGFEMNTYEKEKGDVTDSFTLGAVASEIIDDTQTQVVYFPCSYFLDQTVDQYVSGANSDLFLNAINFLCQRENHISIRSKNLANTPMTVNAATATRLEILLILVLPACVLIYGGIVCLKRRKR